MRSAKTGRCCAFYVKIITIRCHLFAETLTAMLESNNFYFATSLKSNKVELKTLSSATELQF